jgi:hypothetical protein
MIGEHLRCSRRRHRRDQQTGKRKRWQQATAPPGPTDAVIP